jgi:hypothetical protein
VGTVADETYSDRMASLCAAAGFAKLNVTANIPVIANHSMRDFIAFLLVGTHFY